MRGPDALVGEVEATDGRARPATVTALEAVEALMVSAASCHAHVRPHSRQPSFLITRLSRCLSLTGHRQLP